MRRRCLTSTGDIINPPGPDQLSGSARFLPALGRRQETAKDDKDILKEYAPPSPAPSRASHHRAKYFMI